MSTIPTGAKAKWKPDQLATNCDRCRLQFGLLRRKHHCRRCGGVFCDTCCASRVMLPGYGAEPQRVCKICEAILAGQQQNTSKAMQQQQAGPGQRGIGAGGAGGGTAGAGRDDMMGKGGNNNANKLPSLEVFPRERRVLLIGSPGVGKGSFVATACGGPAPSSSTTTQQQQQPSNQQPGSSSMSPGGWNDGGGNDGGGGGIGGGGGGTGGGGNVLSERRRQINYQGQNYSLVLVNTAGSTVSSDMFVHPLLTIGTSAYVFMYDVTEPKSFEVLPLLHERLLDCGAHDKAMLLVGSKADHVTQAGRERVVTREQATKLARQMNAPHVDCASTSRESVDAALIELLREIAARDHF